MDQSYEIPDPHHKPPHIDFYDFLIAGVTPMEQGFPFDEIIFRPHGMHGYILNLTTHGKGLIYVGDKCFEVERGDLVLFPPYVEHHYRRSPSSQIWYHQWVYFFPRGYWQPALIWPEPKLKSIKDVVGLNKLMPELKANASVDSPKPIAVSSPALSLPDAASTLATDLASALVPDSATDSTAMSELDNTVPLAPTDGDSLTTHTTINESETLTKLNPSLDDDSGQHSKSHGLTKIGFYHLEEERFQEFTAIFTKLIDRAHLPYEHSKMLSINYLEEMLWRLVEIRELENRTANGTDSLREASQIDHRVKMACVFIEENLTRHDLSVQEIASFVGLSASRITHLFEKQLGISPIKWRDLERFKLAKSLLVGSDLSIESISFKVGILDVSYFFKFFKRFSGQTPGDFRHEIKHNAPHKAP